MIGSHFFYEPFKRSLRGCALLHHELFCSGDCLQRYFQRTTTGTLRRQLFDIEGGVCQDCGLDCASLQEAIKFLPPAKREERIIVFAPKFTLHPNMMKALCSGPVMAGHLWHADHIVPVWQGGGECGLDNMRTLCVCCHADVTARQATERAASKARERDVAADGDGVGLRDQQDIQSQGEQTQTGSNCRGLDDSEEST